MFSTLWLEGARKSVCVQWVAGPSICLYTNRGTVVWSFYALCVYARPLPGTGSGVTCDQVSLAFNNNDEMKASYVGTSDQRNLSRTHVDSCQGSVVTFGLWEPCHDMVAMTWGRLRIYSTHPMPFYFLYVYFLKCIRLLLIKHVSELTRSLELTIWSDLNSRGTLALVSSRECARKEESFFADCSI